MTKAMLVLVLSCALVSSARADLAASAPAAPVPPVPSPEMEQMRKWEGSWKTLASFAKGGMMPEGGEAKGTYTSVRGLNGHAYIGDYKASGTGGDFAGHGVRMWDPETKKWKTWWYDSWVPGHADISVGEVGADGTFVTESDSEYQGHKFRLRITERWVDDNKVEQAYESDLGKGWTPVMSVTYTRKGKWKEKPAPVAKGEKKHRKKDKEVADAGAAKDDKADKPAGDKPAGDKPDKKKHKKKKSESKDDDDAPAAQAGDDKPDKPADKGDKDDDDQ